MVKVEEVNEFDVVNQVDNDGQVNEVNDVDKIEEVVKIEDAENRKMLLVTGTSIESVLKNRIAFRGPYNLATKKTWVLKRQVCSRDRRSSWLGIALEDRRA